MQRHPSVCTNMKSVASPRCVTQRQCNHTPRGLRMDPLAAELVAVNVVFAITCPYSFSFTLSLSFSSASPQLPVPSSWSTVETCSQDSYGEPKPAASIENCVCRIPELDEFKLLLKLLTSDSEVCAISPKCLWYTGFVSTSVTCSPVADHGLMAKSRTSTCFKCPMAVITGATICQANVSELRRRLDSVCLEELPDSRERTGAPVLWLSCEGQIDVRELFLKILISAPSLIVKDFWLHTQ